MRALLSLVLVAAACGGGEGGPQDASIIDSVTRDAPEAAPTLTSFVATPNQLPPGVATDVTWNWTYAVNPTLPDPSCAIEPGVGPVARGQTTSVTLTTVTTFTLTCTNEAGSGSRQVVVSVPPVAPQIASFTISPSTLMANAATPVTFNWTYAAPPSPTPTCTLEHGVGVVTPGATSQLALAQARTYRLRCTNSRGTSTADATVAVNECASGTHDCQSNATCVDTVESFACQCKNGFTGNGDTCSAQVSCGTTPSLCHANASCIGGASCACNAGYVGDGTTCTKLKHTFVTTTTGTGNLSSWVGANGQTGLAAADAVCASTATNAGLTGTYVAWMSDASTDAYCRAHGLTGKKATNCGLGSLPVAAGPWARPNGTPVAPTIDKLLAPTRQTFFAAGSTSSGDVVTFPQLVWTGTDDTGVYAGAACQDWTASVSAVRGAGGEVLGGGQSWTDASPTDPTCDSTGRLRCIEVGAGPALPSRHPTAKRAFVTSVSGNGQLMSWPDANDQAGINAADTICQARARFAGYAMASSFKAWMASSSSATSRFFGTGAWARPDGIIIGTSESDLVDGRIAAPIYQTETNAYVAGNAELGAVWTGTSASGSATFNYCSTWTSSSAGSIGTIGRHDTVDSRWLSATTQSCSMDARLYCLQD